MSRLSRRLSQAVARIRHGTTKAPRTVSEYLLQPLPHERAIRKLFDRDPPRVIFDIGACEGEDSIRYRDMFPTATVYAFEPRADNLARIDTHLATYGADRIRVVPVALSDREGTATFYVSSGRPPEAGDEPWDYGNKSSSLLPPAPDQKKYHAWLKYDETITVPTRTLAGVLAELEIGRVDLAHIDVQGAELMALRGAGARLRDVRAVWLEVEAVELYRGQPLRQEVEQFMRAAGFRLALDTVGKVSGDQLWVNDSWRSTTDT